MKTHEIIQSDIFNDYPSILKDGEKRLTPSLNSNPNIDTDQKESTEKYLVVRPGSPDMFFGNLISYAAFDIF